LITKIDWLSFTLPIGDGEEIAAHRMVENIATTVYDFSPVVFAGIFGDYKYEKRKGRAPYSTGYARSDAGCYIFCHPVLPHFLIELTGQGCSTLSHNCDPLEFLRAVQPRLTRIDVASDMLCDTNPLEFAALRDQGRFKSHSEFVSETGTTAYVGSRTSNRYARVYRYNHPHERAHLLRAEHVLKAEDAKASAQSILDNGLASVTVALGSAFGWTHASWTPQDVKAAEIAVWRPERHAGKTLFWLNSAVAPALIRLAKETGFDVQAWLAEEVLTKLNPDDNL
jgi:hypothetical protein